MAPPLCFIPASQRSISIMSPYLTLHLHACLSSFVIHHKQVSLLRISGWFTILWYFHRGDEEKMYIGNTSANCSGNPPLIFLFPTLLTGVIAPPPSYLTIVLRWAWFSPSTVRNPGIEVRSPGSLANTFPCWTISQNLPHFSQIAPRRDLMLSVWLRCLDICWRCSYQDLPLLEDD